MKRIFLCLYFLLTLAAGLQAENLAEATYNLRNAYRSDSLKGNDWGQHYPYIAGVVQFYGFDIFGTQESFCDQLQDLKRTLPEYDYIGARRDDGKKRAIHRKKSTLPVTFRKKCFRINIQHILHRIIFR